MAQGGPESGAHLEFRLLGPLEVWKDGRPLRLGGERQRALLALLLFFPVSSDPLEKIPPVRLAIWPLARRAMATLRLVSVRHTAAGIVCQRAA